MSAKTNPSPTPSLNILQIISGRDVNGALEHCRLLSRQLCRRGNRVTIMCRRESWLWKQLDDMPVGVVQSELARWRPSEVRRMAAWVSRQQFDVIHTHMSRAHMYGIILRQLTGIPVVATAHSQHFQPHWHLNDRVICNSDDTLRYYQRVNRVARAKTRMVHCFIDLERFSGVDSLSRRGVRRQWRVAAEQRVIGIAGDVVPHKGHWYLFRALPRLLREFPDLKLVVVGRFNRNEKFTAKLRRFQLHQGLDRRVKWLGRRDNMHEMLGAMDVVAVPSLVESMGMVALESMAAGTPVVAARTGGLVELIQDGRDGILVGRRDVDTLATGIASVLGNDRLRAEIIENGRQRVAGQFGPDAMTAKIEAIYREVVLGEGRRAVQRPDYLPDF